MKFILLIVLIGLSVAAATLRSRWTDKTNTPASPAPPESTGAASHEPAVTNPPAPAADPIDHLHESHPGDAAPRK